LAHTAAPAHFTLGTYSFPDSETDSEPFAGLLLDDQVWAVQTLVALAAEAGFPLPDRASVLDLLMHWPTVWPALAHVAKGLKQGVTGGQGLLAASVPVSQLRVHAPLMPRQIFMCGANYFKHVVDLLVDQGPGANPGTEGMDPVQLRAYAEDMMNRRRREGHPYFFCKPLSTLAGPHDAVRLPAFAKKPDWELELAVVMGRAARHVRRADALSYVAGYTIANDISNRDHIWVQGDMKAMGTDWITGKSCPTYLPMGPALVPAAFVPDPQDLRITLKLNGQVMQDERTADMIFDVARQIEHLSSIVQLWPGDVICTGSPAGNGTHYQRFLQPGDVLDCSITGLGAMRNPVLADGY
jgi:2,4-didehydro-3-deoxy-L-rhamnonate hydrolase